MILKRSRWELVSARAALASIEHSGCRCLAQNVPSDARCPLLVTTIYANVCLMIPDEFQQIVTTGLLSPGPSLALRHLRGVRLDTR